MSVEFQYSSASVCCLQVALNSDRLCLLQLDVRSVKELDLTARPHTSAALVATLCPFTINDSSSDGCDVCDRTNDVPFCNCCHPSVIFHFVFVFYYLNHKSLTQFEVLSSF